MTDAGSELAGELLRNFEYYLRNALARAISGNRPIMAWRAGDASIMTNARGRQDLTNANGTGWAQAAARNTSAGQTPGSAFVQFLFTREEDARKVAELAHKHGALNVVTFGVNVGEEGENLVAWQCGVELDAANVKSWNDLTADISAQVDAENLMDLSNKALAQAAAEAARALESSDREMNEALDPEDALAVARGMSVRADPATGEAHVSTDEISSGAAEACVERLRACGIAAEAVRAEDGRWRCEAPLDGQVVKGATPIALAGACNAVFSVWRDPDKARSVDDAALLARKEGRTWNTVAPANLEDVGADVGPCMVSAPFKREESAKSVAESMERRGIACEPRLAGEGDDARWVLVAHGAKHGALKAELDALAAEQGLMRGEADGLLGFSGDFTEVNRQLLRNKKQRDNMLEDERFGRKFNADRQREAKREAQESDFVSSADQRAADDLNDRIRRCEIDRAHVAAAGGDASLATASRDGAGRRLESLLAGAATGAVPLVDVPVVFNTLPNVDPRGSIVTKALDEAGVPHGPMLPTGGPSKTVPARDARFSTMTPCVFTVPSNYAAEACAVLDTLMQRTTSRPVPLAADRFEGLDDLREVASGRMPEGLAARVERMGAALDAASAATPEAARQQTSHALGADAPAAAPKKAEAGSVEATMRQASSVTSGQIVRDLDEVAQKSAR